MTTPRVFSLDGIRADGWFEGIRASSPEIERIIEIVGEMPFAFSIILGVHITAVSVDVRNRDASAVDFAVGDDTRTHRIALGEFRRRLASSLTDDSGPEEPLPEEPESEDIESFLGSQLLLLSALFGLSLRDLVLTENGPPRLRVDVGRTRDEITVADLRRALHERVVAEVMAPPEQPAPFSIDLGTIPKAEEAARRGDSERVVALLGAWSGPLSVLLRTADGQQLSTEVKSSLAHALGLLGSAQSKLGRQDIAEDVMRLGIQWAQDGAAGADLFRRLGESFLENGRAGEAIGLLRRALALGGSQRTVLPLLAAAYASRGKMVAAAACLDEAAALGVSERDLAGTRARVARALGDGWTRFRDVVPVPSTKAHTMRPLGRRTKD